MKVFKGIIVSADEDLNLFGNQNGFVSNDSIVVADEEQSKAEIDAATAEAMRAVADAKTLQVTPSVLSVKPGTTNTLRVRSNCGWRVSSYPEAAVLSRLDGFGDNCIEVSAPDGADVSGVLAVTIEGSDDVTNVELVEIIATDLPTAQTEE